MTVNWAWDHNYYTWVCPCCGSPIPTDYYDNHPDEDPWEPPSIAICPSCGVPITKRRNLGGFLMKKIVRYESYDHEEFDTEEECLEYERAHFIYPQSKVEFFDSKNKRIDISEPVLVETIGEDMWAFIIRKLDDDSEALIERIFADGTCYEQPHPLVKGHVYSYDPNFHDWIDLTTTIQEAQDLEQLLLNGGVK